MSKQKMCFSDLPDTQKTKIRDCAKWNFYSEKCQDCENKLFCAAQWKIEKWFPGGEK
jgi:hypothetical protein